MKVLTLQRSVVFFMKVGNTNITYFWHFVQLFVALPHSDLHCLPFVVLNKVQHHILGKTQVDSHLVHRCFVLCGLEIRQYHKKTCCLKECNYRVSHMGKRGAVECWLWYGVLQLCVACAFSFRTMQCQGHLDLLIALSCFVASCCGVAVVG